MTPVTPPTARHATLAGGRWQLPSLAAQLGNIGSEVERALRAMEAGDADFLRHYFLQFATIARAGRA